MPPIFNNIQDYIVNAPLLAYSIIFLAGIVVGFTPCVYPLIPITVGYIGSHSQGKRLKGFILSLSYVTGVAITYAIMGGVASLTGKLFGQLASSPIPYLVVGNVCILAGLSLLEVIYIPVPGFFSKFTAKSTPNTIFGPLFMGLFSGLVVGPCTYPALGAILFYVGTKQNVLYGMSLLFTFAYGMGFLLILIGTFTGLLVNIPKSGVWMVRIKKGFGFVFLLFGEYFLIKSGRLM